MRFRPCIDIHNGCVKQIVGSSLKDKGNVATDNFVSLKGADYYATLYKENNLPGGHIILLNPSSSEYYEKTKEQALLALKAFHGGLQVGGGINPLNAEEFLEAGASHVIVTSYCFKDGIIMYERIKEMVDVVGRNHLVLDLSCRNYDGKFYVTTDRWQNKTTEELNEALLEKLAPLCDEFLIHAVDVEGKANGIEDSVVDTLSKMDVRKVTYAGGISDYSDIEKIAKIGKGNVDYTVGSALDLFGGRLEFDRIKKMNYNEY